MMSVRGRVLLKSLGGALLIMLLGYVWMPLSLVTHFLFWSLEPWMTRLADSGGDWFLTDFLPFVGASVLNLAAWVGILYAILSRHERRRQHKEAVRGGVA